MFAAERNDGRPWRSVMEAWNSSYPDEAYVAGKLDRFIRDCRIGFEKLTGASLRWGMSEESDWVGTPWVNSHLEGLWDEEEDDG